jgi:hypothetical protein
MKNPAKQRRAQAPNRKKGDRLVGRCDRALKKDVARAQDLTGLDESKLVRLSVETVIPSLLNGQTVLLNGKLVPAHIAAPAAAVTPTGTEG